MKICKHKDDCGGCTYQGVPYADQLKEKEAQVLELLTENKILCDSILPIEPSPSQYRYRNKMEYTFGDLVKDGELTLGMHQRGRFFSIVTVDQCQLVHEDFNRILKAVLTFCREKNYTFYHKKSHKGLLRHLVLRRGVKTNEILVNIVTTTEDIFDEDGFVCCLESLELEHKLVGVLRTFNDSSADAVICEELKILQGRDYYMERILELDFKVSAFSFFQTNVETAERLYRYALDLLDDCIEKSNADCNEKSDRNCNEKPKVGSSEKSNRNCSEKSISGFTENTIFDLFCGTGTITQALARKANKVIGIELVEEAVISARQNAERNGLDNCTFLAGDVFKVLDNLEETPEIIIVDPPRAGITDKTLAKIAAYKAKYIIYISCNPKTLAQNLVFLQEQFYQIISLKPFDNFANTKHVEVVVFLVKQR